MSLGGVVADAEGAVATGGASIYLKLALKLAPYIVIALLAGALFVTRATLHDARQDAKLLKVASEADLAKHQAQWANDGKNAAETYAKALADRQLFIVHATDTVRQYAQTPAGAAVCASADRVSSTDLLDRQLWPAQPAKGGN